MVNQIDTSRFALKGVEKTEQVKKKDSLDELSDDQDDDDNDSIFGDEDAEKVQKIWHLED